MKLKGMELLERDIIFNKDVVDYGTNYYHYMVYLETQKQDNDTIKEISSRESEDSNSLPRQSMIHENPDINRLINAIRVPQNRSQVSSNKSKSFTSSSDSSDQSS